MRTGLLFVPSPLVTGESWAAAADELRSRGWPTLTATLADGGEGPWWARHQDSAMRDVEAGTEYVLVLHSGAGPLAGVLRQELGSSAAGAVFVDAGLPRDGESRLDLLRREMGDAFADRFQAHLGAGGCYPEWNDGALAGSVDNPDTRRRILAMQRPRGLAFWTEKLPAPAGWEGIPCGYLRLSAGYAVPAAEARGRGWPVIERDGGHFDLMVKPAQVATDIESLLAAMSILGRG